MPLARSTPPNMPPAPVISTIEQIGPSAWSTSFSTCSRVWRPRPSTTIASSVVISSAMGVCPIIRSACTQVASPSTSPAVASVFSPVLRKISTSGSRRMSSTVRNRGGLTRASSASFAPLAAKVSGTGSSSRRPVNRPNR